MQNITVNEFKLGLNDKEYTFRFDFKALLKFTEKYKSEIDDKGKIISKDAMEIFNEFLRGENIYSAIVKIMSCACIEKEFTEEELEGLLSFDFKTMRLMDEITFSLAEGILVKNQGGKELKNEETSQEE